MLSTSSSISPSAMLPVTLSSISPMPRCLFCPTSAAHKPPPRWSQLLYHYHNWVQHWREIQQQKQELQELSSCVCPICLIYESTHIIAPWYLLQIDVSYMSIYFHLVSRHRRSGTFMQQFRSHISSSQNSASRFRMNLILFHQVPNSDSKSNYQVLFSHASFFFAAKMRETSDMESHSHPKNLLETWSAFLLFVRLGVLATYWISETSGQKATWSSQKENTSWNKQEWSPESVGWHSVLTRTFITGTYGLLVQFAVWFSHVSGTFMYNYIFYWVYWDSKISCFSPTKSVTTNESNHCSHSRHRGKNQTAENMISTRNKDKHKRGFSKQREIVAAVAVAVAVAVVVVVDDDDDDDVVVVVVVIVILLILLLLILAITPIALPICHLAPPGPGPSS